YAERLTEGPERTRATAIARSVAVALAPPDPDRLRPVIALDVLYADHRSLGWGTTRGQAAFVRAVRTVREAVKDIEVHTDRPLALRTDALLVRRTVSGQRTDGGGQIRRRPIALWAFGPDGRLSHWEQYDHDDLEAALARFDALARPAVAVRLLEN